MVNPPTLATDANSQYDDDGRVKRTGTLLTTSAHILTAVLGIGVLSLAWAVAQLGWVAGPFVLVAFSVITWFTSALLADCYRSNDPINGKRNYTYMDAVKSTLGGIHIRLCGIIQYTILLGICIGFTISGSISMAAVKRTNCFHKHGRDDHDRCSTTNNMFMIIFGCIQIFLSQIPNFHKLSILSTIATVMSFAYSIIGLGLCFAKITQGGNNVRTSLTGTIVGIDVTSSEKVWNVFGALGNIAAAYSFSNILIEIQDTIRSGVPENKVMKKAAFIGISATTVFYLLCGLAGYAAFGNVAPGNFLTGFYEPFWLIDMANVFIVVHIVGAYQVFAQPLYAFVETYCMNRWPEDKFMNRSYIINIPVVGAYNLNLFQVAWRTLFVAVTTLIATMLPFFNNFLGLLGAFTFWPLTVYFPVEMYICQAKIRKYSRSWIFLQSLSWFCLIVSILAAAGSARGLVKSLNTFKLFNAST